MNSSTPARPFREAQAIAPDFAPAYWGEAPSYNRPLWFEQDRLAAHTALAGYASAPEDRMARAPPGRERGLMEAVDILYGSGDKLSRDIACSEAMRHLHETYPEDDEIATLYALSLLGTVRRGDKGFGRQVRAGAIAMEVFARNPRHPGAAHLKPAHEMYGEFLLARGRMEEAAVQFSKASERTPNRTRPVRGLEPARRHASDVGLPMK